MKSMVLEGEALCHELVQRSHQPGLLGQGTHAANFVLENLQHVAALLVIGRPAVICALSHTWQMASLCMQHGDPHYAGNVASKRAGSKETGKAQVPQGHDQGECVLGCDILHVFGNKQRRSLSLETCRGFISNEIRYKKADDSCGKKALVSFGVGK